MRQALLALANGSLFWGTAIGADGSAVGEVVFNTAMTGYQEILTDPSYAQQIITLTYPHIGNVGVNPEDNESDKVWAAGLVIRDLSITVSNWRSRQSLPEFLISQKVVAIADIDTRQLTTSLRDLGVQRGCIITGDNIDADQAIKQAQEFSGLENLDLAKTVTTPKMYQWHEGSWQWSKGFKTYSDEECPRHIVVLDYGVKRNILRLLVDQGCRLTVVPATTPATTVIAMKPDGILLSNGPGDPAACDYAIKAIQEFLKAGIPLLGICLGHQLLALACGAKTQKMKYGHHGANHPVIEHDTGRVVISSQNHGFSVSPDDLPDHLQITHQSLFDQSVQGIRHKTKNAIGYQGHPEASPGPHDLIAVIQHFVQSLSE